MEWGGKGGRNGVEDGANLLDTGPILTIRERRSSTIEAIVS